MTSKMHKCRPRPALVAIGLAALAEFAGCVPNPQRQNAFFQTLPNDGAKEALAVRMGCPLRTMPSWLIRDSFGSPHRIVEADGLMEWQYHLQDEGPILTMHFQEERLVEWHISQYSGAPAAGRQLLGRSVTDQVLKYLRKNAQAPPNIVFAMTRGCPVEGMDAEQLVATLGPPFRIDTSTTTSGAVERWLFKRGVEGQALVVTFSRALVIDWDVHRGILSVP